VIHVNNLGCAVPTVNNDCQDPAGLSAEPTQVMTSGKGGGPP